MENFWKEHGGHYTLCVERHNKGFFNWILEIHGYLDKDKNRKKDRKAEKNERKERQKHGYMEISLANRKYDTLFLSNDNNCIFIDIVIHLKSKIFSNNY